MNRSGRYLPLLNSLLALEVGEVSVTDVVDLATGLFVDVLRERGWVASITDCGRIARTIYIELFPEDPFARTLSSILRKEREMLPEDPEVHQYAVERGLAVLMISIQSSEDAEAPRKAAETVFNYLEKKGCLPLPEDVREY